MCKRCICRWDYTSHSIWCEEMVLKKNKRIRLLEYLEIFKTEKTKNNNNRKGKYKWKRTRNRKLNLNCAKCVCVCFLCCAFSGRYTINEHMPLLKVQLNIQSTLHTPLSKWYHRYYSIILLCIISMALGPYLRISKQIYRNEKRKNRSCPSSVHAYIRIFCVHVLISPQKCALYFVFSVD